MTFGGIALMIIIWFWLWLWVSVIFKASGHGKVSGRIRVGLVLWC